MLSARDTNEHLRTRLAPPSHFLSRRAESQVESLLLSRVPATRRSFEPNQSGARNQAPTLFSRPAICIRTLPWLCKLNLAKLPSRMLANKLLQLLVCLLFSLNFAKLWLASVSSQQFALDTKGFQIAHEIQSQVRLQLSCLLMLRSPASRLMGAKIDSKL